MADPICRWRNSSVKQVIEFNLLFPLKPTERLEGRDIVERNWSMLGGKDFFTTPYQLAAQMAIYYEDDSTMYPRFNRLIDLEEAYEYMQHWGRKYYAPNPYTKSMQQGQKPLVINNFLVNWVIEKGNGASFNEALKEMFVDTIGNTDILVNMINNFMDVQIDGDKVSLKNPQITEKFSDQEVWPDVSINDKKAFFEYVGESEIIPISIPERKKESSQIIYFGAPGTGKSFEINRITKGKKVIRTTFHPDSDYSTFVGAYKPTSIEVPVRDVTGKIIIENGQKVTENRIVYDFVEQAFLQAYTKAWIAYAEKADGEKPEEQYLVIEEINRGNCAQIFGDLFQLLDRNGYGFSDYPITADKDMKKQLAKAFEKKAINDADRINSIYGKDIVSQVLSGDILLLPDNLYIWATMNTSDQSLFPIDSAFKRRWDWKYMPICEGKENGVKLDWKIKVKDNLYDWWQFVQKINDEINEQTKSEDKKLGYFFCKAQDSIITAETFVSKVIFYLWNDVFKDQAFASDIFRDGEDELTFNKFYDVDNKGKAIIKEDKVELFLSNLEVEVIGKAGDNSDGEEVIDDTDSDSRRVLHVEFADETIAIKRFPQYLQVLQKIGLDKAEAVASEKQIDVLGCALVTKNREEKIDNSQYSYVESEGYYVVKGIKGKVMLDFLPMISDRYNLNLKVEYK